MGVGLDAATITTASAGGTVGRGQYGWWARLTPKLLSLRLITPREGTQAAFGQQTLGDLPGEAGQRPSAAPR